MKRTPHPNKESTMTHTITTQDEKFLKAVIRRAAEMLTKESTTEDYKSAIFTAMQGEIRHNNKLTMSVIDREESAMEKVSLLAKQIWTTIRVKKALTMERMV